MLARWKLGRIVHCVWFFALMGALTLVWSQIPRDFYEGGEGKWTQNLIRFYLNFVPPFQINALNPIEGHFSPLYPLNLWLHPGNIQFTFLPFDVAMNTSMLTYVAVLALAIYACARQIGMGPISAAIAAQCAVWFFPHFNYVAGISTAYQLNPTGSWIAALFILLLVLVLRVDAASSLHRIAGTGLAATALVGYIVYNDPMSMGLVGFCMAPAFAVAVLAPLNIRGIAARLSVLAVAACILAIAGLAHYILAVDYYTARYVFRAEIPRAQVPGLASMLFSFKNNGNTLAISSAGMLLGLVFTRDRAFLAVPMGLAALLTATTAGTIYLFTGFRWWLPLSIYLQFFSLVFVFMGAVAGYSSFLQWVGEQYASRSWRTVANSPALAGVAMVTLPAVLVYVGLTKLDPAREPYPDEVTISKIFAREIGLAAGRRWNGSVYVAQPDYLNPDYRMQLTIASLWKQSVPTFNFFSLRSQTITPVYHFMFKNIVLAGGSPLGSNTDRLAALGVRYIMLPTERDDLSVLDSNVGVRSAAIARYSGAHALGPDLRLRHVVLAPGQGYRDFAWLVYELPDPNLGHYSPTTVKIATNSDEYRHFLTQKQFNWRRDVVMEIDPGALSEARDVKLFVERGRIRVEARSAGAASMVVLPVQYSDCLKASGAGNPRLVRANLLYTGLLFSGETSVRIDFDFGFRNSGCRWSDIAHMKQLGIPETVKDAGPALHPFIIRRLSDIPARLGQLYGIYRDLR